MRIKENYLKKKDNDANHTRKCIRGLSVRYHFFRVTSSFSVDYGRWLYSR